MDLFGNLALGLATAVSVQNLFYCFVGVLLGHADRRAAGDRPGRHHRHAAADHLRAGADLRPHHAGRHLLRGAVRRLHHRNPRQSPRRGVLGRDLPRRLPDGAPGTGRPGAGDRRDRLVRGRHRGDRDLCVAGRAARRGRRQLRSGGILLAHAARPDRRGRDCQPVGAQRRRHGDCRPDPRTGRHRRELRRPALHVRRDGALRRHRLHRGRCRRVRHRPDRGQPGAEGEARDLHRQGWQA